MSEADPSRHGGSLLVGSPWASESPLDIGEDGSHFGDG
jgi:hypothetical protein